MIAGWAPWAPGFPLAPPGHPYPSPQFPMLPEAPGLIYAGAVDQVLGYVCAAQPGANIPLTAAARKALGPQECGHFVLPAELDGLRGRYVKPVMVYAMWPGFFVGCIPESSIVVPGGVANVLVFAINATPAPQAQRLHPGHFPAPPTETAKMAFSLPPFHWGFVELSFIAPQKSLKYFLQLQSSASSERAGKALATGLLTLGTFVHTPGYRQLQANVTVTTAEHAASLAKLSAAWLKFADTWLGSWPSDTVTSGDGQLHTKEDIRQRFWQYLTPDRIQDALKGTDKAPIAIWRRAFFGFTTFALGRSPQSLAEERAAIAGPKPPGTP